MKQPSTIRKIVSLLLAVVFFAGSLPQSVYHDALANHKDAEVCRHEAQSACVHTKGFHCGFIDMVVSLPYLAPARQAASQTTAPLLRHNACIYTTPASHHFPQADSRGPPRA